jgi:hypothetical protein
MKLEHRLQYLELKFVIEKPGCNVTLFIVIPEEMLNGPFNYDSYRPLNIEIEKYLKHLIDSGQCQDCKGACAIDWSPDGFKNHTLVGGRVSSSPGPNLFMMFCADAEIPILCRQLINARRESSTR